MQFCNKRVTQVTTNLLRQLAKPVPMVVEDDHHGGDDAHIAVPKTATPLTVTSMNKFLLKGNASITTGLNSTCRTNKQTKKEARLFFLIYFVFSATTSVRHAHTDIQVPNFDYYRRKGRLDPSKSYRESADATSPYSYLAPLGKT